MPEGFDGQCRQAWRNLLAALAAADMDAGDIVKLTTYLTDRSQADANGRIRRETLPPAARPALTVVVVDPGIGVAAGDRGDRGALSTA